MFLLAVLGAQVVSAQDLPPCTEALASELTDNDGVDQAVDIDKDGDGLIEICDLEGLYEMRYVPDGSGYRPDATATTNTTGCPTRGCAGFELTRNLSFINNSSYRTPANRATYTAGSGWQPIGTSSNCFNTEFEGSGHTISNLRINRRSMSDIGLFGVIGVMANIADIGLRNVRITARNSVGGLVGNNGGSITNSYATGSVEGNLSVGGLVGSNDGSIMSSYATASVKGLLGVGGLAGENFGPITNSYATGFDDALVGTGSSAITNSSTKTIMALQTPTTATGIYSDWSIDVWDFGTENDLPTLKDVPEIELIRIRTKVFLEGPLQ